MLFDHRRPVMDGYGGNQQWIDAVVGDADGNGEQRGVVRQDAQIIIGGVGGIGGNAVQQRSVRTTQNIEGDLDVGQVGDAAGQHHR